MWKTFYNWICAINAGEIDINKSRFIIYCNKYGRKALINDYHAVQSNNDAVLAIKKTRTELKDIDLTHEIWEYYNFVINKNEPTFKCLIKNFEFVTTNGTDFEEIRNAIKEKHIPEEFIDYLLEHLLGWLQKEIIEKISKNNPAIIKFDDFNKQFIAIFYKLRTQSLIDWTLSKPPKTKDISDTLTIKPNFVKQLDIIAIPDEEIVEAVSDFIKADTNRSKWIETGVLDEEAAIDFESRLLSFWKNSIHEVKITNPNLSDEHKGHLLLIKCKCRQETINNLTPPDRTIPGTYHALSNRKEIGWHPDWNNKLENK